MGDLCLFFDEYSKNISDVMLPSFSRRVSEKSCLGLFGLWSGDGGGMVSGRIKNIPERVDNFSETFQKTIDNIFPVACSNNGSSDCIFFRKMDLEEKRVLL